MQELAFEAIGTQWLILFSTKESSKYNEKHLLSLVLSFIDTFDKSYSRFRNDSLVTKMSKHAGRYKLPPDGYTLLQYYEQLYKNTEGKVTPLIGQVVADAGYDATYSFRTKSLSKPPSWDSIIKYDKSYITLTRPVMLDFGAAGKGYLVDLIGELLEKEGINSYTINAGGDILQRDSNDMSIEVGLENPNDFSQIIGVAYIKNQSISASSGSKRKWGNFTHIIDPDLLSSPKNILSTWVVAKNAMLSDGLATALFFAKSSTLRKSYTFSFAILYSDMSLEYSHDFPAAINQAPSL